MDSIEVLEEIGLQKVSQDTHIEQKYLKYMINKDFDKLNRINTLGFVKILSREYNLDLSEWVGEFEEYWAQNRINPEEDDKLFVVASSNEKSRKFFISFVLIIFLVIAGISYTLFTKQNMTSVQESVVQYDKTPLVQETQEEIQKYEEENETKFEQEPAVIDENSTEQTPFNEENTSVKQTEVAQEVTKLEDKNTTAAEVSTPIITEKKSETFTNQAIIIPKMKLWIGVIYLDTFKRRSYLGEGNFSINLSRDQIITTGHGEFALNDGIKELNFTRQSPIRFEVKDGVIEEIPWSRFKELNKGKNW
jgi:cytoskeletal protein RodZ